MVCTSRILTRFRSAAARRWYAVRNGTPAAAPRNCRLDNPLDKPRARVACIALNSVPAIWRARSHVPFFPPTPLAAPIARHRLLVDRRPAPASLSPRWHAPSGMPSPTACSSECRRARPSCAPASRSADAKAAASSSVTWSPMAAISCSTVRPKPPIRFGSHRSNMRRKHER